MNPERRAKRVVGVIPARLASTRLPRKPLLSICGHPMIGWVYGRARAARVLDDLAVATDSDEMMEWCRSLGIPALMTSPAHRSGTDRLVEVLAIHTRMGEAADIYVNIQGDEPAVDAEHLQSLLLPFSDDPGARVSTLKVAMPPEEAADPNKVKVTTDANGRALYFSRSRIPYDRDGRGGVPYFKHLGFYAYSAATLAGFRLLRQGPLEQAEKLEQLRFLENGIPISVIETVKDTTGVDTEEDLRIANEQLRGVPFPEWE